MSVNRALRLVVALAALLSSVIAARAESGLGPDQAESTLGGLRYQCLLQFTCPLSAG